LISRFNINTAGFVIVGLFLATWLAALLIWRYARIEEKWNPAAPKAATGGVHPTIRQTRTIRPRDHATTADQPDRH
jgi:high-affinity nickel-transport protein